MLFNSLQFLLFFPIVTILYFILRHQYRWFLLLMASCLFYCAFIPKYLLILLFTIVIDYFVGIIIENSIGKKRKAWLIISLIANIGILAIFKYYNFLIENFNMLSTNILESNTTLPLLNIILPIGLSFHTFQAMSYTIEVYRGNQKAEKHFGIYALYVMFYPQLVAGPIERPQNILHQFYEKHEFNYAKATAGLRLILWGLFKKCVIADRLANFTDPVFNFPNNYDDATITIAAIFFSFQIFCDFSGYSDIALGTAKVMGFDLMKNFDRPYSAKSIGEFWSRWHISLSTWFRDYLYIPLGGNRTTIPRYYMNIMIVFMISGLWHGANWTFIVWGGLHGLFLIIGSLVKPEVNSIEKKINLTKLTNIFKTIFIFCIVTIAWIFFRASNFNIAFHMLKAIGNWILNLGNANTIHNVFQSSPVIKEELLLSFFLIILLELIHAVSFRINIEAFLLKQNRIVRWGVYYIGITCIILLGVFEHRQFIYFQF